MIKAKQHKKVVKDIHEMEKIIAFERHERFCKKVSEYLKNFEFNITCDCFLDEWAFIQRAVRVLSPLVKPTKLAEYLEIDSHLVYDALEDSFLPHFTDGHTCYIKTACILFFLRKYSII